MSSEVDQHRARLRRRRLLWTWVPTGLLVVIIAAAVITAVVVTSRGVGKTPASAPPGAVTESGYSMFTEAGRAYMAETRVVAVDGRDQPVDAAALGLPADGTTQIAPAENVTEYLRVTGSGGTLPFSGTSISVSTAGGELSNVAIVDANAGATFHDAEIRLRADAKTFGMSTAPLDSFADAAQTGSREGTPYSVTIQTEDSHGLAVAARADCSPDGICGIRYTVSFG